jgi:hypothetical protein
MDYTGKAEGTETAMDPLQMLASTVDHPDAEAFSALPGAPVRATATPAARAPRTRRQLAAALHRLADAVAPPAAAPRGAYAGSRGH